MPDGDDVFDTDSPGRKAFRPLQRAMISICRIQERIILSLYAPAQHYGICIALTNPDGPLSPS